MNEIKRNGVAIGKHKEFDRFVHASYSKKMTCRKKYINKIKLN